MQTNFLDYGQVNHYAMYTIPRLVYMEGSYLRMERHWRKYLYVVTLLFLALGIVNVLFAVIGLTCMFLPFALLARDRKKTWCQSYCPRASLFTRFLKGRSLTGRVGPDWLANGKAKWVMLAYFSFNLFVITMSTIRVSRGLMEPFERLRFLVIFRLPWRIPQLVDFGAMPGWAVHLSYRIYSMMFTTIVLGLILGWLFYPSTWCRVCPINTLSDLALDKPRPARQSASLKAEQNGD